jgi:thymidylate synthase (FAD)
MSSVYLIGVTQPTEILGNINEDLSKKAPMTAEQLIAYCARVSNPANQDNPDSEKLLKYLVKNKHWSPFEMIHVIMEINTTRDIGRQILRHRSFSFQEFSQRYAAVQSYQTREPRHQDSKNRQNSVEFDMNESYDEDLRTRWFEKLREVMDTASDAYKWALDHGIAKEQARVFLPEGLTMSRMYMSGSLRSWIHYCELRMGNGTQKEHREIATECWNIITREFPSLKNVLES